MGIVLGVFMCVFPDVLRSFSWVENYAVQLMLFYLFAGLAALFLKQPKLTFAFFGGSLLLCFFLKYSMNNDSIDRWRQQMIEGRIDKAERKFVPDLKIAHVNLTNASNRSETFEFIEDIDPNIVFFHEVTPNWAQLLLDSMNTTLLPHHHTMIDLGIYGMSIYSKHEITGVDTFYFNETPNLVGQISANGQLFNFVDVHLSLIHISEPTRPY